MRVRDASARAVVPRRARARACGRVRSPSRSSVVNGEDARARGAPRRRRGAFAGSARRRGRNMRSALDRSLSEFVVVGPLARRRSPRGAPRRAAATSFSTGPPRIEPSSAPRASPPLAGARTARRASAVRPVAFADRPAARTARTPPEPRGGGGGGGSSNADVVVVLAEAARHRRNRRRQACARTRGRRRAVHVSPWEAPRLSRTSSPRQPSRQKDSLSPRGTATLKIEL